jgi:hypothetical protein
MSTNSNSRMILSYLTVLVALFILSSCRGNNKSIEQNLLNADSLYKEEFIQDVAESIYPLPTPFEMTNMLTDIGATYNSKIVNPSVNVNKYLTEQSKAVGLGIYGADLTYASTFQQQQDIQTYLGVIKTLADQLGIDVDYAELLSDENKEKYNNKDSLTTIITRTIFDTYQYLDEMSNPDLSVLMVTGVWIELMYIATHVSEDSYNYTGIVDIIVNQKGSFEKVLNLLDTRNTNGEIKDLEVKLQVLTPVYDKVTSGLSKQDYETILLTIRSVRNSIIAG